MADGSGRRRRVTRGLFFTGTDTGVGKTRVVCAVALALRRRGVAVAVRKPVATGATLRGGRWVSDDTLSLARAAGLTAESDLDAITPFTFPVPAAPPVAARLDGVALSLSDLAAAVRRQSEPGQLVLAEGVGGLLCPLTGSETVADLADVLRWPVVVVTRRSLGTLNHTLLTVEVALNRGLPVAGIVVNETTPPGGVADETNVTELGQRVGVPILAVVPFSQDVERSVEAVTPVDWPALASKPATLPAGRGS
jgi:dethiobiotin synthetase